MNIAFIGLGKMGYGLSKRAKKGGFTTYGYDPSEKNRQEAAEEGIIVTESLKEHVEKKPKPRVFLVMVPAGDLADLIDTGDIVVDGGNSYFKDSVENYQLLKEKEIDFLDCGTSGGLKGEEIGYSMMIGGEQDVYETVRPLFEALAAPEAYDYMGEPGSGHYVKMVHNGVEYAIMQAMAEGFELIKEGEYPQLDMVRVTKVWKNASIIRSYLMDLAHEAFVKDPELTAHSDRVDDNGMGRWTVKTAIDNGIPAHTISEAVYARFRSQQESSFAGRSLAALRNEFGGHKVHKKEE